MSEFDDARVPPNDISSEDKVVAAVFEDEVVFDVLSDRLKSEHFYDYRNKTVYSAFEALRVDGLPIDYPMVVNWLKDNGKLEALGSEKYIEDVYNRTPATLDPDTDADRIIEAYKLRQFINLTRVATAQAYITPMSESSEVMGKLIDDVSELADTGSRGGESFMREAVRDYAKNFEEKIKLRKEVEDKGLPFIEITTGITELDDLITGLNRGDLTIVAARPGMGKSAMGLKMCMEPCGKLNYKGEVMVTAFFSLEMPKDQVVVRAACYDSRVNMKKIRDLSMSKQDMSKYYASLGSVSKMPMIIVDKYTAIDEIESKVRKLKAMCEKRGQELAVVVIDYLQLITSQQSKSQTRENVVSELSRRMKRLANACNVALVVLAQLNRDCEQTKSKRPRLHNLRESGSIEQDADNIIFLFRQDYYSEKDFNEKKQSKDIDPEKTFEPNNKIDVDVAKQRNGPTGLITCRWTGPCARIDNLEPGEFDDAA